MTTSPERVSLAIVGSGRAALSVLSRVSSEERASCVVIDPSASWLHAFARTHLRLGTTHLRCATTHVPFESACGLERYVETTGKRREVYRANDGMSGVPSVRVYAEYCALTVAERFAGARLERGAVTEARWCAGDSPEVMEARREGERSKDAFMRDTMESMRFGAMVLTLDTGKTFIAARCVWTPKFSTPVTPSWVVEAKASYAKVHGSYDGQSNACGIFTARDVDVGCEERVRDKIILVVGGGWTAATLAVAAQRRGARAVTPLSRRKISVSEYECDKKYFGNKGLYEFRACEDPQIRARRLESYKSPASVNEHTYRQLRDAEAKSGTDDVSPLYVSEQRVIRGVTWSEQDKRWRVRTAPTDEAKVEFESTMYRRYRDEGIEPDMAMQAHFEREVTVVYDEIWFACGETVNIAHDPALQRLIQTTPTEIARGLPALVEEKFECAHEKGLTAAAGGKGGCRWPGTSMYVIGAYAALTIGPCADLSVGHRLAAKQIVETMKRHQSMILQDKNPYDTAARPVQAQRTPDRGETFDRFAMLPPDLADKGLIDIDRVLGDKNFERVELDHFEMYEEDLIADIRLKLPESIMARDIYVCFQERALEMWAIGEKRAYRFFIPKLYKNVIVDRCSYKVQPNRNRVILKIQKYTNHYWRFLRG